MLNRLTLSALIVLALSAGAAANIPADTLEPSFVEGSQYTAVLDQSSHQWRLLPGDGIDLAVNVAESDCKAGAPLPGGIWLVTRDDAGRPALIAPSATALPAGHPEQVALRLCSEPADGQPHVAVPEGLMEWLTYRTGAILVEN